MCYTYEVPGLECTDPSNHTRESSPFCAKKARCGKVDHRKIGDTKEKDKELIKRMENTGVLKREKCSKCNSDSEHISSTVGGYAKLVPRGKEEERFQVQEGEVILHQLLMAEIRCYGRCALWIFHGSMASIVGSLELQTNSNNAILRQTLTLERSYLVGLVISIYRNLRSSFPV